LKQKLTWCILVHSHENFRALWAINSTLKAYLQILLFKVYWCVYDITINLFIIYQ
jgi:hypothetical protein